MEVDPQRFFEDLLQTSKDGKKSPFECCRLLQILNRFLIEEQVNSSLIDLYLIHIFDKSNGLIYFLNSVLKNKNFKNATGKGMEILYILVSSFPLKLVESNILDVYSLCINIIKLDAASEVKVKTLELLFVGLEKLDICVESNNVSSSYKQIFVCLQNALKQNHCDTVKHKELIALGFFAKKYRYLIDNPKELQQLFVGHFQREMNKQKISQHVTCGFFTGFSYYCESFPLNSNDKILIDRLYKFLKVLVRVPTERVKIGNRAALLFLANNGKSFEEPLLRDYKFWHSSILKWIKLGEDDKKVGVTVLRSYFEVISTVLYEKSEGNWQPVVIYFNNWSRDILQKRNANNHEKRLCIQCLRIFSNISYKYLSQSDITDLFLMVMQKFEYNYVLNYDPNNEEWEYLPYYVQTISKFIQFKTFSSSEFYCLQRAVLNMIKSFHHLPYLHYPLVIDGIVVTCFYLKNSQYFDAFVENIIYQGVIWTCSHEHISKAEFSKDTKEKIVTINSFSPLWKGILKSSSNRSYDKYGMYLEDRKYILNRIVKQLIKTLMILINKLNLSVKLKEEKIVVTELEEAYQVEQINDYAIFLNITDFYQEIFDNIDPTMFKNCIIKIIKHIINKCVEFPLTSGFYKLLSYTLKIANNLNLFRDCESKQDVINSRETLTKFLEILLSKMIQYKDELLISCLQVLLECPVVIIKHMLPACIVPFLTIFNVGRSFLPLAEIGLKTLEYWQDNINSNDLDLLLTEVIPSLDSYLRSKSLQGQTHTNLTEKRRKTVQPLKKRKVLMEIEPELIKLQKTILSFIGKQNSKICRAFVYSENFTKSTMFQENLHLKVTLPYEDLQLDIHLDSFVLRVVNLALYCSDRKTRITACELLQATVMIFLGRARPMTQSGLSDLDDVLKSIAMPLLQLGCDIDQLVQQIFAPLFLQLIHWYTSPTQSGAHTNIIVDVLMEGITHPTDTRLRDYSGKCVNEFVRWTIKQTNRAHISRDPINIKFLVKKMRFFSSHPHPAKKIGGALIFNNIYQEIREEESLISIFWIDILHIFVISLSLIDYDFLENDNVINQIKNAVSHLQRVFVEKPNIFRKSDNKRRIPSDIKGCHLKDVAIWLFEHTGSKSRSCRKICMNLFITICPLISSERVNLESFIKANIADCFISNIYEKFILTNQTPASMPYSEDCTILLKWMQGLLCLLDGYNFVIKHNLGDINLMNNPSFVAVDYFIEKIHEVDMGTALNLIKHKSWTFTALDIEHFNKQKSLCILSILEVYNSIINNEILNKESETLWTRNFWKLILNMIFNPQLLGLYDRVTRPRHLELLTVFLNTLPRKISQNTLFKLVEALHNHIEENYFTSIELKSNIPLIQRNLIKGLLLLTDTSLKQQLNVEKYTTGLVNELIQNFYSLQNNQVIFINELQETTFEYCELILKFALANKNELKCLIDHLYQPYMVQSLEFNKEIIFGIYFLNTFTEVVLQCIVKNFDEFLNLSRENENWMLTIEIIMFILNYITKNKQYKDYGTISKMLMDNWNIFEIFFETCPENIQLGTAYSKLLILICDSQTTTPFHNWLINSFLRESAFDNKLQFFYLIVQTTYENPTELRLLWTMIENCLNNLERRYRLCVEKQGRQFEQFL